MRIAMLAVGRLAVVLFVFTYTGTALAQSGAPVVFSERFARQPGKPQAVERTIVMPPWVVAPFTMTVQNGEPGVSDPVPAWISIDGVRVASPPDGSLARTVALGPRSTIEVKLTGDRQRSVAVAITGMSGDRTAPQATLVEPAARVMNAQPVDVRWRYADLVGITESAASGVSRSSIRITADGTDVTSMFAVGESEAYALLALAEGSHTLQASMSDVAGNQSSLSFDFVVDRTPPELTMTIPVTEAVVANTPVAVRGDVVDATAVTVTVDGDQANVAGRYWSVSITPAGDGYHVVTVVAIDAAGNESRLRRSFVLDTTAPVVRIADPLVGGTTAASELMIRGTVDDPTVRSVTVNGIVGSIAIGMPSTYEAVVPLSAGDNVIVVTATDATGRIGIAQMTVTRIIENPCMFSVSPTAATLPADGGGGLLSVSTSNGCSWSASTDRDWIALGPAAVGYGGQIAADGAAGYWRFDEIDSSIAADVTGHGFDGTLVGNFTQGVAGALADGSAATLFESGSVQFATGPTLLGGPFSVEAWIREPWWGTLAAGAGWQLTIDSGRIRFRAERNEVERFNVRSERSVDDFEWHHVAAVYDPAQQTTSIFIDGVLDVAGPTSASPLNGGTFFMIGPMAATLDEVAVYRSSLTASQIAAHVQQRAAAAGGSGSVTYAVASNPFFTVRSATVVIAGQAVRVTQAARQCFTVAPTTISAAAGAAEGTLRISALDGACSWTALSGVSWIDVLSTSGTGAAELRYALSANVLPLDRTATLTIAGQSIGVSQLGMTITRSGFHFSAASGQRHSLALKDDGAVWSWGANDSGQLGDGTTMSRPLAVPLLALVNIVSVAAGDAFSLALKSDGTLWAFGANGRGQLGNGTVSFQKTPVQVSALTDVIAIAAGSEHSVALRSDGTVWTWGRNNIGQLGDSTSATRTVPARVTAVTVRAIAVAAAGTRTVMVDAAGRLWEWGSGTFTPSPVALSGQVINAYASASGWFARAVDGTWLASALTVPTELTTADAVLQVAAGASHTLALRSDGRVSTWSDGAATVVSSPASVVAVAANPNGSSNIAVSADGRVWTWGSNDERQLGDGTSISRPSPVQIADAAFLWHTGTPVVTAGGVFNVEWIARAASATPNAVIHYTLNGVDPTEADPVMPIAPEALAITQTTTLKARAWAAGKPPSEVASETYTLKPFPVIATPPGGSYSAEKLVTLTSSTSATLIRYTVDGSEPTAAAPAYSAPITVATGTVVKASAFRSGWTASDVVTAVYAVNIATAPPTPDSPPPPRQPGCVYQLTPGAVAAPSQETSGVLTVMPNDASCGWSVNADASWLTVRASGNGSPYARAAAADRPIGYWRLTDAPGAVSVADASGFDRPAVVTGGVTFGRPGPLADQSTAAGFDGRTGSIEIAHDAALDLSALTWEAWVNVPLVSSEWRWILGAGGSDEVFSLWIAPASRRATLYYDVAGGARQAVLLNATVVGAGWVHLAFTYGAAAWHVYVNGVEDQRGPATVPLAASADPIVFGRDYVGDSWYDGELAEVALYPVMLSADAIARHVAERAVMVRGGGQVTYGLTANRAIEARSATMTVASIPVPVMQAPPGGVAIAGATSSAVGLGAEGWTSSDAVVTFACAGDGAIACAAPVTLSREGEHEVAGEAVSDEGAMAATTVRVRVDKGAPYLSVTTPMVRQMVSAGALTLRGSSIDLLSGLADVTCNGQPATVSDVQFVCALTVPPGTSTVALRASDMASNVQEAVIELITEDVVFSAPPSQLRLTPQGVTMVTGEIRRFSVLDDFNRLPARAEWTIDNAAVATLRTTPDVELTAVSAGSVVLTASWQGLTATTQITVIGAAAPIGTPLWSQPPVRGAVERVVQGAVTLDSQRRIYALEHDDGLTQDLIRAFDADGTEVWATTVPGHVTQLSGDPFGGVVALHGTRITGVTAGGSGFPVAVDAGPGFAIDAKGRIYYVRDGVLIAGSGTLPLPQPETPDGWVDPGIPTVLEDGGVAVPVRLANSGLTTDKLQLVVHAPEGGMSVRTVWESPAPVLLQNGTWLRPPPDAVTPYKAVPNGRGDLFVAWSAIRTSLGGGTSASAYVGVVPSDGQPVSNVAEVGGIWGVPGRYPYGDVVVAEDRVIATAYRLFDQQNEAVASQLTLTGLLIRQDAWAVPEGQVPQFPTFLAAAGGGFVVSYPDGTMGADDPAFNQMRLANAQYQGAGTWIGATNNGPAAVTGPRIAEANSVWATSQGSRHAANAALKPGTGIKVKSHNAFLDLYPSHASLRVVPREVGYFLRQIPDLFKDELGNDIEDGFANLFFTIGAGPAGGDDTSLSCGGILTSGRNRTSDVTIPPERIETLQYSPVLETRLIERLIAFDKNYRNNLTYACFPELYSGTYNSNSYISGLLNAAEIPLPKFPVEFWSEYPGWPTPVPVEDFLFRVR
jgi:hypothetical protein